MLDAMAAPHPALEALEGVTTLPQAFQATCASRADQLALRSLDGATELTFAEYAERVRAVAAGLAGLGVSRGDRVGLMLLNRPEFHYLDAAVMHLGATAFSVYATSSPEQIKYLFDSAANDVVITEQLFLDRVLAARGDEGPEHVICIDGEPRSGVLDLAAVEAGAPADFDFDATWQAVEPDDVLTLIYTSGTTGPPKGVELTHAGTIAQWRGVAAVLPLRMGGRMISYLPMAHIADRTCSHYAQMMFGYEITSIPDPTQIAAALVQVRPEFFGAVPRVAEKLKAAIEAGIAADPDENRRAAMNGAIALGIERVKLEEEGRQMPEDMAAHHALAEQNVLAPLRAKLGLDRADWIMFGAAPLPLDVHRFLRGIGLATTEVFGMSESSCIATTYPPSENRIGTVGRAIPGVELALAEDGEVLLRGETVMRGYRGEPEKTAEAVDSDGWLHTGDIGELDAEGNLRIIDRKKELIINAAGKNMSPALIEGHIKGAHPLIGQAVVIGDGRPYNVALLVLDPDAAAATGASASDSAVLEQIAAAVAAANERLSRVEQVKSWTLLADEWLPGGDELTPTMKLKRKPIAEKYTEEIEALYSRS